MGRNHPIMIAFLLPAMLIGCARAPVAHDASGACERLFRDIDGTVMRGGARDAGAYRIRGFPYLRVNRFLASFRDELAGEDAVAFWAERLRRLDMRARRVELSNLYQDHRRIERQVSALRACGREQLARDLADPDRIDTLRRRARVDDAYRDFARVAGAYPLAVPFLKLGIADWRSDRRIVFARRAPPPARGERMVYDLGGRAGGDALADRSKDHRDNPLGLPMPGAERLADMARRHAPVFVVDAESDSDHIGAPYRRADALGVDADRVEIYWRAGMTRFHGRVLLQLAYVAWFAERPPSGPLDPYAGRMDGLIWRVTLDENGRPLLYDSIHPCGCYHQFFPTERVRRRKPAGYWREGAFVPQSAPAAERVAVWIAGADHYVQRVSGAAGLEPGQRYRLRRYDRLRLRRPQRLFDATGLVPGSERLERWFLWPSGVRSPGAMRQWGHHATAFVGKRHFDDPFLLERYFRPRDR